ncbi:Holo-[acyl-carrier-protein] synthase [Sterolibacterium denitrificans]|uniref:Holo-[acyl-carrier-protein] synthase n=1 Tax=Sterolibacterium denitrificans TaxID=157592 RepID=A0A7Z7MV62_9PROT|nr:holo-ACP synthase [Sterolibacterium denitrificans]SMB26112.1 Holo-[acyl-carrier-protein] synthase [Sterolibacterium denitrificans]
MIFGIGTDIVSVRRFERLCQRHGERALKRILASAERDDCRASPVPARFLAKRFAAKEALGKALGTGVRAPLLLPAIRIVHDALGKPGFEYSTALAAHLQARQLVAHLSISDEQDQVIAFVILEQR